MDASNPCVNSAGGDNIVLLQEGEPKRLPKDRGIFRNWGVFMGERDIIYTTGDTIEFE